MQKIVAFLAAALILIPAPSATAFENCKAVNSVYPGGIAKSAKAKNMTVSKGKSIPAKSKHKPKVDAKLYRSVIKLDRDKDGIACEK